jgi:predicted RNA binding protein YcfA (HicA-like mRNA interferase family)
MPSGRAADFRRIAKALGFDRRRQRGSHEHWEHPDGRFVTIPVHGDTEIGGGLFFSILKQLNISLKQFQQLR